jgi:hypothetical protein
MRIKFGHKDRHVGCAIAKELPELYARNPGGPSGCVIADEAFRYAKLGGHLARIEQTIIFSI